VKKELQKKEKPGTITAPGNCKKLTKFGGIADPPDSIKRRYSRTTLLLTLNWGGDNRHV